MKHNAHLLLTIWPWSKVRRRQNFLKLKDRYLQRTEASLKSVSKLSNPNNNIYKEEEQAEIVRILTKLLYKTIDQFPSKNKWHYYMQAELEHYSYLKVSDPDFYETIVTNAPHINNLVEINPLQQNESNEEVYSHFQKDLDDLKAKFEDINIQLEQTVKLLHRDKVE